MRCPRHVCFALDSDRTADIQDRQLRANFGLMHRSNCVLFDHLVGERQQTGRNFETRSLCRLYIERDLEFDRSLRGQVAGRGAFQNTIDIGCERKKISMVSAPYDINPPSSTFWR